MVKTGEVTDGKVHKGKYWSSGDAQPGSKRELVQQLISQENKKTASEAGVCLDWGH